MPDVLARMKTPHSAFAPFPVATIPALSALVLALVGLPFSARAQDAALGIFEGHSDIGNPQRTGTALFDPATNEYSVSGGGGNIWGGVDHFQFIWKKLSGDLVFAGEPTILPSTGNPKPPPAKPDHRKAVLMIRQSLDADSPYFDVSSHAEGMTALQWRDVKGGDSYEIRVSQAGPKSLRIEKHGDNLTVFFADKSGDAPHYSGASHTLKLQEPFYVGLGVCSHVEENLETAIFAHVELKTDLPKTKPTLYSTIETQTAWSGPDTDRYTLYTTTDKIAGPLWLADNSAIVFGTSKGLFTIPVASTPLGIAENKYNYPLPATGLPVPLAVGGVGEISLRHGLSPDGKEIVFASQQNGAAAVFAAPVAGGTARKLVDDGIGSSLSPDGKTVVFIRRGKGKVDVFTAAADGSGKATNLTAGAGLNYDPAYTADGKTIYFTSDRSGKEQVWRMKADGTAPEQVTADESNNWFASVSKDGAILFVAYPANIAQRSTEGEAVVKRITPQGKTEALALIHADTGTGPSWSPDGLRRVFISREWVY
jgi:TolB protein